MKYESNHLTVVLVALLVATVIATGIPVWMEWNRVNETRLLNLSEKQHFLAQKIFLISEQTNSSLSPDQLHYLAKEYINNNVKLRKSSLIGSWWGSSIQEKPDSTSRNEMEHFLAALHHLVDNRGSDFRELAGLNAPMILDSLNRINTDMENRVEQYRLVRLTLLVIPGIFLFSSVILLFVRIVIPMDRKEKERNRTLSELNRVMERNSRIIDENIITSVTDLNGVITDVSGAFLRLTGYSREELIGKTHGLLHHPDTEFGVYEKIRESLAVGNSWRGILKNRSKIGLDFWVEIAIDPIRNDSGDLTGYIAMRRDLTQEKRLEDLAVTDEMTGLFNRRKFNRTFPVEIYRQARAKRFFCFVLLDVDHFKLYNDTYGHQNGDGVLISIGKVLRESFRREDDFCFRLGGEEFGVVFAAESEAGVTNHLMQIKSAIQGQGIIHEKNSPGVVTASFGAVIVNFSDSNQYAMDQDEIYRLADRALYRAKEAGRNRVAIYRMSVTRAGMQNTEAEVYNR